ncbi:MAG: hypothetical protein QM784_25405 [Polyangiaceae bacterium]
MRVVELLVLYVIAGVVSAIVVRRRCRANKTHLLRDICLSLLLWPLWLPVILSRTEGEAEAGGAAVTVSEQALYQGYEAVRGTPLEKLLPRESVERIAIEIRRVVERDKELTGLLGQPSFSLELARARVREFEQGTAPSRALLIAQRHLDNVERLVALHTRDRQLLAELGDWLTTLRTQLVLARYSASSADGVGDIFAEICARVEVLGSTLDEAPFPIPAPPSLSWPNTFS